MDRLTLEKTDGLRYLFCMNLLENLRLILLEDLALQIQQLKDKYVGEGKPMTEEDFNKIQEVSGGKFNNIAWLSKRVGTGMIKAEDIYKFQEYFQIFEKNKKKFTHKDLNLYKTAEDLQKFIDEVIQTREGDIVFDEITGKDNFVSQADIEKLESTGGAKYLGIFDNEKMKYQVFQIFGIDQKTWKTYRDVLGKCKGRNRGAKIEICTIGDYRYFRNYLTDRKGSSYFLLYNLDDPKSPYQLHFESGQFMDKNDNSNIGINQIKFYEFVGDKVPRYSLENENFPGDVEIPVKGKGTQDEKKRRQGIWKYFENGKLRTIVTYVNDKEVGPFVTYHSNGKINRKGTRDSKEYLDGDFVEYHNNGNIEEKGTYSKGDKIGIWIFGDYDGEYRVVDFNEYPNLVSGFTKNNKLKFVSNSDPATYNPNIIGDTISYFPSGQVKSIGKLGKNHNFLGEWTLFFPDGKIRLQGKFLRGRVSGEWTNVVKMKNGTFIFVANYSDGGFDGKVKVYDKEGNYLKKMKPYDLPDGYSKSFEDLFSSVR